MGGRGPARLFPAVKAGLHCGHKTVRWTDEVMHALFPAVKAGLHCGWVGVFSGRSSYHSSRP